MKTGMESVLAFVAGLGAAALSATAEEIRQIELANGETLEGIVIPASECPVVVQTEDLCLEVPLDRIRAIDGREDVAEALRADRPPLLRTETFEELREDGDVLVHSSFARANRSAQTNHVISWGLAPHEIKLLEHWKIFDEFGNELPIRTEQGENGRWRACVNLVRPVLPGEIVRHTSRILFEDYLVAEGDALRYRHRGDYAEDRLVSKMLRLPAGAEILSISPEPAQRFEVDGVTYVQWRHYYHKGEETPLELTFRPAEEGKGG